MLWCSGATVGRTVGSSVIVVAAMWWYWWLRWICGDTGHCGATVVILVTAVALWSLWWLCCDTGHCGGITVVRGHCSGTVGRTVVVLCSLWRHCGHCGDAVCVAVATGVAPWSHRGATVVTNRFHGPHHGAKMRSRAYVEHVLDALERHGE